MAIYPIHINRVCFNAFFNNCINKQLETNGMCEQIVVKFNIIPNINKHKWSNPLSKALQIKAHYIQCVHIASSY